MACCLTAPSHYLNFYWLIIKGVLWHSPESNVMKRAQELDLYNVFRDCTFKITTTSPRGQWVNCVIFRAMEIPQQCHQYIQPQSILQIFILVWLILSVLFALLYISGKFVYSGKTRSILWVLMPWLLPLPAHQQPCNWLWRINGCLSCMRKDLMCPGANELIPYHVLTTAVLYIEVWPVPAGLLCHKGSRRA